MEGSGSNLVTRAAAGPRARDFPVLANDFDRAVLENGEPCVVENAGSARSGLGAGATGVGAYVGVPLSWGDGRVFGVLAACFEQPRVFAAADHEVLVVAASALTHDLARHDATRRGADDRSRGAGTAPGPRERQGSGGAADAGPGAEFFASIIHEMRTPLAAIGGAAEALLGGMSGRITESQQRLLEVVKRGGDRMARLVDNLRELARLEAGRFAVELSDLDLREPARQALASLRPLAEHAGIRLHGDLPAVEVRVRGDSDRLVQVLVNLVENAIRHARHSVRITLVLDEENARLAVIDDGPGVRPEEAARIFEPWNRAEGPGDGTPHLGLGLTIVKRLVEAHGGVVTAVSPPPRELASPGAAAPGFACLVQLPLAR